MLVVNSAGSFGFPLQCSSESVHLSGFRSILMSNVKSASIVLRASSFKFSAGMENVTNRSSYLYRVSSSSSMIISSCREFQVIEAVPDVLAV